MEDKEPRKRPLAEPAFGVDYLRRGRVDCDSMTVEERRAQTDMLARRGWLEGDKEHERQEREGQERERSKLLDAKTKRERLPSPLLDNERLFQAGTAAVHAIQKSHDEQIRRNAGSKPCAADQAASLATGLPQLIESINGKNEKNES